MRPAAAWLRADAVSGGDMTIEAAVTKLYYLFSCGYDKDHPGEDGAKSAVSGAEGGARQT